MANVSAAMVDTLQPTYSGFVRSSRDVCLLLEMVLSGRLPHVPRRPHERERAAIVKSGNIFIYEETASGVRRWTDGINWSPSRILGNFLIYREVEPGYPGDGGKKTALKRNRGSNASKPTGVRKNRSPNNAMSATLYQQGGYAMGENELSNISERDLFGSLIESYPFKEGGLVKKTITVTVEGVPHHLVSYYKAEDILTGKLKTPSMDPQFIGITPRDSLLRNGTFRVPVEQEEYRINENSEAYITQDQAHVHGLYQPQQGYQPHAMHMQGHDLPDHGLPAPGMTGMQPYGQPPFGYPVQQQFSAHAATSLAGGIQGLAPNGMDAINNGQYQQPNPGALNSGQYQQASPQSFAQGQDSFMSNGFHGGPSRHISYTPAPSSVYAPSPAQSSLFGATPTPGYPAPKDYRQPSVPSTHNGYAPAVPAGTPANPSPVRDIRGAGVLEGDQVAMGSWPIEFTNSGQGYNACNLPRHHDINDLDCDYSEDDSDGLGSIDTKSLISSDFNAYDLPFHHNNGRNCNYFQGDTDESWSPGTDTPPTPMIIEATQSTPLTSAAPPKGISWPPVYDLYLGDVDEMAGLSPAVQKGAGVDDSTKDIFSSDEDDEDGPRVSDMNFTFFPRWTEWR